jgi:hypothetical protein
MPDFADFMKSPIHLAESVLARWTALLQTGLVQLEST